MSPLEITVFGVPIGLVILFFGLVSIASFIISLCLLVKKVKAMSEDVVALTARVSTQEYLLGELVSRRVDDALTEGWRDLNEVGRS